MFAAFLESLFDTGRVQCATPDTINQSDAARALDVLKTTELRVRADMPGTAPEFDAAVALKAAEQCYRACQFLVYRDVDAGTAAAALREAAPHGNSAECHYSVDLTFRYLPDVLRLARATSAGDPLIDELRKLAARWPLSSVGIDGMSFDDAALKPILEHPALKRMYVDRIIERAAADRLGHTAVSAAVRAAIGPFPHLAPELARALAEPENKADDAHE